MYIKPLKKYYTVPDIIKFTYTCTITVLSLTTVCFMSEVLCISNVLHSITPYYYTITYVHTIYKCKVNSHITVQSSTIVLLRSTVDCHLIKV